MLASYANNNITFTLAPPLSPYCFALIMVKLTEQQTHFYFPSVRIYFLVCNEHRILIGRERGYKLFTLCLHLWAISSQQKTHKDLHEASSLSSCSEDLMVAILELLLRIYIITVELSNIYITFTVLQETSAPETACVWPVIQPHAWDHMTQSILHLQTL